MNQWENQWHVITSSEKNSGDCWDEFTNGSRTGQYPQGTNHLHSAGNNLRFHGWESFAMYQISTSLLQFSGHKLGVMLLQGKNIKVSCWEK